VAILEDRRLLLINVVISNRRTLVAVLAYYKSRFVRKGGMSMVMPTPNQRISPQQAMQIAVQRVPGQIIHYDMDMENGILVYEIYILTPYNKIYEVEVNAKTGVIRKIEEENDYD